MSERSLTLSERELRTTPIARLASWVPWPHGNPSLIGHADITFGRGLRINGIPIFRRADGSFSAGTPNTPQLDSDGRIKLRDGKKLYLPVVQFETAEARESWSRAVLGALAAGGNAPVTGEGRS